MNTKPDLSREELILAYEYVVGMEVKRLYHAYQGKYRKEELFSWGVEGLIKAIDRDAYDPSKGMYSTYLTFHVNGAIRAAVRSANQASTVAISRARVVSDAKSTLSSRLGRSPSDDELKKELANRGHKWDLRTAKVPVRRPIPRQHPPSREEGPDQIVEQKDFVDVVFRNLDPEQQNILRLHYWKGLSMAEIGRKIGVSAWNVRRMRTRALNKIRGVVASHSP